MTENEAIANLTYRRDCWIGLKYVNNNPEPYVSGVLEEAMRKGAEALEEIQQYRAIGTVEEIQQKLKNMSLVIDTDRDLLNRYIAIGTIEEFKALKEKNEDCIIKHLTNECSYNETGCSDCKGKETIRVAVEIVKKMYEHCEGSCVDCPYHNPNMDKCMNDLLKLK